MSELRTITIPHLGRVEGHGGIVVRLEGASVVDVDMTIHEGSRYYEALLRGKHYLEVQGIITRVCAICSADHTVAALSAIEDALGVPVSERTQRLRDLLLLGATIESHALHVFALALPDYLGYESMLAMASAFPAEATFALRLKQLGNRIQAIVGGRPVHPVNTLVGGFGRLPERRQLVDLRAELVAAIEPLLEFVDLIAAVDVPDVASLPMTYVALRPAGHGYGFRGDEIRSSDGQSCPTSRYRDVVREFHVEHSHAKHAALATGTRYAVGALARHALWSDRLRGRAREVYQRLFPTGVTGNILHNTHAQVVETVHCVERAVELIDDLVGIGFQPEPPPASDGRAGRGVAALEAPRGTLFHEYHLDRNGCVEAANIITPTSQNLSCVERDLRDAATAATLRGDPDRSLRRLLEMIVRAYDPCISCSVHVVRMGGPA